MKPANELPVAVRIVDQHGLVTVVRVTPSGNAFLHVVQGSKAFTTVAPEAFTPLVLYVSAPISAS
jgi:hypothetical protein